MINPLVSICIPTHNRPELLKQALQSALNQTYKNIEIIISDNSNDNQTRKILVNLKNKKIRYHKVSSDTNPFNNGINAISHAQGKYIKILLDDDLLKSDCVEKMVIILEKEKKVGVVMAPLDIVDNNGKKIQPIFYFFRKMKYLYKYLSKSKYIKKEVIINDFLTKIYPCCVPTGIMYRRSLLKTVGGYDKNFYFISDVDICMNFATKMDFYYIDEFLSSWRYSKSSDTVSILHKKGIKLDIFYKLTEKYLKYAKDKRKAYFFASKRTTLNIMAGIRSKNVPLIIETIKTILYNDPYLWNKIILPFNLIFEIFKSLITL